MKIQEKPLQLEGGEKLEKGSRKSGRESSSNFTSRSEKLDKHSNPKHEVATEHHGRAIEVDKGLRTDTDENLKSRETSLSTVHERSRI